MSKDLNSSITRANNMFQRVCGSDEHLVKFLFRLFSETLPHRPWILKNIVPSSFLKNDTLYLEKIDFILMGAQLNGIDFRGCHFIECTFSSQIILNCDFNNATFEKTIFKDCIIDQNTAWTLAGNPIYGYGYHNHVCKQVSMLETQNKTREWMDRFKLNMPIFLKRSYLKQFLSHQTIPLNSFYDTMVMNRVQGFYYGYHRRKSFLGWKLHVSFDKRHIKQGYNAIAETLLNNQDIFSFKVMDLATNHDKRFIEGAQITIYLYQNREIPLATAGQLKSLLSAMTAKLQEQLIQPGVVPASDHKTDYPYFSLRNDGGELFEYCPAVLAGNNYNPYNLPPVFDYLCTAEKWPFSIGVHYQLLEKKRINSNDKAIHLTMLAFLNECLTPESAYSPLSDIYKKFQNSDVYYSIYVVLKKHMKKGIRDIDLILSFLIMKCLKNFYGQEASNAFRDELRKYGLSLLGGSQEYYLFIDIFKNAPLDSALNPFHAVFATKTFGMAEEMNHPTLSLSSVDLQIIPEYKDYLQSISKSLKSLVKPYISGLHTLVNSGCLTIKELRQLDESRQFLVISNAATIIRFRKGRYPLSMLQNVRMDILYAWIHQYDEVATLCNILETSMEKLLEFGNEKVAVIFANIHYISDMLSIFGMLPYQFLALPVEKIAVLLTKRNQGKTALQYINVLEMDIEFIDKLLQNSYVNGLSRLQMEELSRQSLEVQNYCFDNACYLDAWVNHLKLDFRQFYDLRQLVSEQTNFQNCLTERMNYIFKNFGIQNQKFTLDTLMSYPLEFQLAISTSPIHLDRLLTYFCMTLDDLMEYEIYIASNIMESAELILDFMGKMTISWDNIINVAKKTIIAKYKYSSQCIIYMTLQGIPLEKIFDLNYLDLCSDCLFTTKTVDDLISRYFPENSRIATESMFL